MRFALTCLLVIATKPTPLAAHEQTSVAVMLSGSEVWAKVADDGSDVALSIAGKREVPIGLPDGETVSEIRMARWMNVGVVLAVETRSSETNEISYFWSTAWVNPRESELGQPVVDRFLKSKIDYDLVGVVNSQGDSIYITLLRHRRFGDMQSLNGWAYVHNCPVAPVKGELLPLTANTNVAE